MSRVALGEVCREYKGRAEATEELPVVGLEHLSQSDIDLVGCSHEETTFTKAFKKGHVLFGRRRAYLKKASLAPFDGVCSGDIIVIEAIEERLLPRLLPFVIQNDYLFDFAVENSAGSLSPRVKWKDLSRFEFELPSMEKQRELADLLWAAQETKRAYTRLVSACDEIIKSRFVEMFGDPIDNEMGWPETTLLGSLKAGRSVSYGIVQLGDEYEGSDGVPVFRPVDIAGGRRPLRSELKVTAPDISARYKRTLLSGNELLVTVRGSIGETLQVDAEFAGCNVGRNIVPLVTDESIVRQQFLDCLLHQDAVVKWLASITKGIALQGLNMGEFKKMRVIMPPLQNQDEFVSFVQQVDKSEFALKQAIEGVSATMAAILNQELGMSDVQ